MITFSVELRVEPRYLQSYDEDGDFVYQNGFYIRAYERRDYGDAQYTYQPQWFETEEEANKKVENLCGHPSNGYNAIISEGDHWKFTGASY